MTKHDIEGIKKDRGSVLGTGRRSVVERRQIALVDTILWQ